MKAIKLYWGISGPLSILVLTIMTVLSITILVVSGLNSACDYSNSIIRRNEDMFFRSILNRDLPALRNALKQTTTQSIDSISFRGSNIVDRDIFGEVVVGNTFARYSYECKFELKDSGLYLGSVASKIYIPKFATDILVNRSLSIVFFWLVIIAVMVFSNYRSLKLLNAVNLSLEKMLESNYDSSLEEIFKKAGAEIAYNSATRVILNSISQIFKSLSEVASLRIDVARAEDKALFAKQVGHDIRSPLTALRILMDRSSSLTLPEKELLTSCYNRVEAVANNLINSSYYNASIINALECLQEVIREKELGHPNLVFKIQNETTNAQILGSRTEIQRVFSNLLNNSIEAYASVIHMELYNFDSGLKVVFSDNGHGIGETILDKLRGGHTVSTKGDNHGLGLSHAIRLVKDCGGSIDFAKSKWNGAEIKLFFRTSSSLL